MAKKDLELSQDRFSDWLKLSKYGLFELKQFPKLILQV